MVTLVDQQGNRHQLTGRLEKIALLVVENAGDIARPQNARIEIDCAGGKVSASIRKPLEMTTPEA